MKFDWNSPEFDGLELAEEQSKILKLFKKGLSQRQIAAKLGKSKSTIHSAGVAIKAKASGPKKEEIDQVEEHRLKRQLKEANEKIKSLTIIAERGDNIAAFLASEQKTKFKSPRWNAKPKGKADRAIATSILSDTHFDEVVNPIEMSGINAYNREIATMRLEQYFRSVIKLGNHMSGVRMDGLIFGMGGDMVSGNIHEELARTNHAEIMNTCLYWSKQLTYGIEKLADAYGSVHIPCVVGNHGRNTKKWQNKGAAENSFDYLIYMMVAREFEGCSEITFDIPLDVAARWDAYSTKYHMEHGNAFRGGNGVGGIAVPIKRGNYKKQQSAAAVKMPYDHLIIGHFHQLMDLGDVLINGSLKGFDEYCRSNNFGYEVPRQLFFLTDPNHGKTISAPVHVISDKEKQLWKQFTAANTPDWMQVS